VTNLYPIMIKLENQQTLVVGGGNVAFRKTRDLLEAGAIVKVISPEFAKEFTKLQSDFPKQLILEAREYSFGDIDGSVLVFSATDNPTVNHNVFTECSSKGILMNSVDDPPNCSFYLSSFFTQGDLLIAVSTNGSSPAMAAKLRRQIQANLPNNIDDNLFALKKARSLLKESEKCFGLTFHDRSEILKKIVADEQLLDELTSLSTEKDMTDFLLKVF